jgi:hypothetical protein
MQEHVENLIRFINSDKMTVKEASSKATMTIASSHRYYNRYLKDPNHNIPVPHLGHHCAQEEKEALIGYIINGKMSVAAASRKAKMNIHTGYGCYRKYFKVQNPGILTQSHIVVRKRCTPEQIKEALDYVINDRMPIRVASRKANICHKTTENTIYNI